jgi:pimeloyl-ACP methyl ester carboxylesterase
MADEMQTSERNFRSGGGSARTVASGSGADARSIACLFRPGRGPGVVWLGGFMSDMRSTKAEALDAWASETGRAFLRFDYSGHGESGGRFEEGTISRWREDALAVLTAFSLDRPILVGSSMGGWIALSPCRSSVVPPRPLPPRRWC